jgi:hypothetical protein
MKTVKQIMNNDRIVKPRISKRFNRMCMDFTLKAYKIDSSNPVSFYFDLFIKRAESKYYREVFPEDKSIEN